MKKEVRYCLVRDDDGHDYVIKVTDKKKFFKLLELEKHEEFNDLFGDCAVSAGALSFVDPKETF